VTAAATREGRLVGVIRRHPVASFLTWSFPVGQVIAFQPLIARAWYDVDLPTAPFVVVANLLGLLLPAVVITRVVDGRVGVRALWERTVRVRVPVRWYGLVLVVVPLATTAMAVALLGPPERTGWVLASALASGLLMQLLLGFLTTNWAEEVAWTGFLQTRLQDRHGSVRAALATGPLFALQHVSLAAGNGWLGGMVVLLFLTATAVPFRFLQGWVADRTGSLFVVGLVHAAGNATTDGSGFAGPGFLPRLYPEETVGPVHLLASAALGLAVLAATRVRLGGDPAMSHASATRLTASSGRPRRAPAIRGLPAGGTSCNTPRHTGGERHVQATVHARRHPGHA
jgi:membrane protease YdiL (CAAX protease family)